MPPHIKMSIKHNMGKLFLYLNMLSPQRKGLHQVGPFNVGIQDDFQNLLSWYPWVALMPA
jgi:hypothetical protein